MARPRQRLARRTGTLIGTVLLTAGLSLAGYFALGREPAEDKGGTVEAPSGDRFTINYPAGWKALSTDELRELPGHPRAVLQRKDGRGFVSIRREKRAPRDFRGLSAELTRTLGDRLPDFQKASSRIVRIRAGRAFMYSYIWTRKGTVHTAVIVPAGERSYAINTVSPGGADKAAREIARIILSFDV